jgi:hypothetical protein
MRYFAARHAGQSALINRAWNRLGAVRIGSMVEEPLRTCSSVERVSGAGVWSGRRDSDPPRAKPGGASGYCLRQRRSPHSILSSVGSAACQRKGVRRVQAFPGWVRPFS